MKLTESMKWGSLSGLAGSLCCVGPLVLVLLGLSGVSGAMALSETLSSNLRWTVFVPLAIAFLALAIYLHVRRREGRCTWDAVQKHKTFVITTVAFAAIVWILLLWVIVPAVFNALS